MNNPVMSLQNIGKARRVLTGDTTETMMQSLVMSLTFGLLQCSPGIR